MTEGREAAAPVARYEHVESSVAECAPVASFDVILDEAAAPVIELGGFGEVPAEPAVPVAGFAEVETSRPVLPRVVRLGELAAPGSRRRTVVEPPAPAPDPEPRVRRARRPARDAAPGPGFGPGPEEALGAPDERPERRKARRRWGEPAELPPGTDPVAAAREICLRLLSDRARTRQELAQALRRKGVPDEAATAVLERFDEVGLIDDAAFAGQWVRSRHNHKGLARRAIAMELRRKGVDDEVAGEALAEVDTASEEERAEELVLRKLRSLTVDTPEQKASATRRLVGMLARKGYGAGIAYRVVKQALAQHGVELDEFGEAAPDE